MVCMTCFGALEGPADGNSPLGAGEAMFPLNGAMCPCPDCQGGSGGESLLDGLWGLFD